MAISQSKEALRLVCRTLGDNDRVFTNPMIYEALGAGKEDQPRRDRIRKRCNQLIKSGELERIRPGEYKLIKGAEPRRDAPLINLAWRAVKSAKPGFTAQDIARRSGATFPYISKWLRHLEKEGHVKIHGRKGNALLYRASKQALQTQDAPLLPREPCDPFKTQRAAVCELVRLFMLGDLYQSGTKNKIRKECQTITDWLKEDQEEE